MAMIGVLGRWRATIRAVKPDVVVQTITFAPILCAISAAALVMASVGASGDGISLSSAYSVVAESKAPAQQSTSARDAMRAIALTASIGYSPAAVSALSMTASVPSSTALATSLASARVGRGTWIILCSIWVAVMTGTPARKQLWIIFFW